MNIINNQLPLSQLPALKINLEGMRDSGNDLLQSLEKAKDKPHVLDDVTMEHIGRVYIDQQKELALYQAALTQWLHEALTQQQQEQLSACESLLQTVTNFNKQVFFLIDFFKDHTIEKILTKSDGELVTELASGKVFPPNGLNNKALVVRIDSQAKNILSSGGDDEALLLSLYDLMGDIKKVMDSHTRRELDLLCEQYPGFYRYMKLLERLASDMAVS